RIETERRMSGGRSKPSPALLWAPFVVAALLVAAYYVVWREGAQTMRRAVDTWAEDQRAAGLTVSYDQVRASGFPFFLRGAAANAVIGDARRWRWSAEKLNIDTLPYALDRLVFSATNPQTLDLGENGVWLLRSENGRASIEKDDSRDWLVNVESGPGSIESVARAVSLSADKVLLSVAPEASDHERIQASLIIEKLSAGLNAGAIDAARIEAFVEIAETAAGFALDLRRIAVDAEGAQILLTGSIHVDDAGYPEGVLEADIANPSGLAGLLQKLGALSPQEAKQASAALTLAAIAGGGRINGPVALKNGEARIAGVKIADLPRID
ncbi:MAG: DUF2125 domain-containing protein, partial [Amphiplicatus sp.]